MHLLVGGWQQLNQERGSEDRHSWGLARQARAGGLVLGQWRLARALVVVCDQNWAWDSQ